MDFNFIVGLVLSSLAAAGKPKAVELLQELYDKNDKDYKAAIYLLNAGLAKLSDVTAKTETKLDDQTVAILQDIVASSAEKNGLTL